MNQLSKPFIQAVKQIIAKAQSNAVMAVNKERVLMYWHIGRHIVEEEQQGKERAGYGTYLIKTLAEELEKDFGSGFSVRQLETCRQFYITFPNTHALRAQLNWTQYKLLLRIENQDKRSYYIEEACNNNWSSRQLERQINSQLYERLLLSNEKITTTAPRNKKEKTLP